MASTDPFAGIRLSEQIGGGKLDQRLFTEEKPVATADTKKPEPSAGSPPSSSPTEPSKRPSNRPAKPSARVTTVPVPRFDLKDQPFYKASFIFTQVELEAIEDLKLELGRRYDTKVTKNNLIRCALHLLLEDHRANGEKSYASRKVRKP